MSDSLPPSKLVSDGTKQIEEQKSNATDLNTKSQPFFPKNHKSKKPEQDNQ